MKLSELKNHINERQINFVAFCMTPWHLVGAKACCCYLRDCGKIVNPIFIALPHFSNGYLLKENIEDNICYLDNDISVTIKKYIPFLFKSSFRRANRDVVYFAMPWYGNFKLAYALLNDTPFSFKFLIFEEGAGTYYLNKYKIPYLLKEQGFSLHLFQSVIDLKLSKLFYKDGRLLLLNPYVYKKNELVENQKAINAYKKSLIIKQHCTLEENRVIIVLQEVNEDIIRIVKNVIDILVSKRYEVYIKPHPRFPLTIDFDNRVTIVKESKALELLEGQIRAKYIISFYSTALISLKWLYGITPISLFYLLGYTNDARNKDIFDFFAIFEKFILSPKNISEFETLFNN